MSFEIVSLADCARVIIDNRGKTCPVGDEGIPLIATNCLRDGALYPTYETERFVSKQTYETWFRGHPEPGDIIFVTKGSPGRVALAPDPVDFCIAQDMVAVRANEKVVYPRFLFAMLKSDATQKAIEDLHVGTMIPHFKKGDFNKLRFAIPSMKEQVKIGDLHFELCDRIDNLRATNATLESIAQALFKSWFIDFDPVRAKMEGREPEGMDAETAALFPSEFEESELGLIPKGWRVQPIGELTEIVGGSTPDTKNEDYWAPGVFHWTSPKDLSGATAPVLIDTERLISEAGLTKISSGLLPPETLLLSSRAPIGYLSLSKIPVAINQGYIAMLPGGILPTVYLYFWTQANMEVIKDRSNGSTFMEISKKMFRPIPALVPPLAVAGRFAGVAEGFFDRITANQRQAHHLSDLRDLLLPRLISGKISIGAAGAALEAA